ncbi:VanZ family protein [Litoribaculum gwangyangense]|uniref:VanZ-like domain-containing protein n=1 Tax=Litoribaculum gwangyangense TaxID=1130722 RepID=A0ABP9CSC3_9FLAO
MRYLLWFLIAVGLILIVYFSWISSPRLAWNAYVPDWIAYWADKQENYNFRTAIPFVFLGCISGMLIVMTEAYYLWWLRSWLMQVLLVLIVELGQLFRPLRSFDIMDIIWGMVGSGLGLLFMYAVSKLLKNT